MGLDVYVMPIWRFKAGDFRLPLTALGVTPHIVRPDSKGKPPARPSWISRWKGRRATRRLQREIEAEIGHAIHWNEKGDVANAQQAEGFESLRAFAKWLDYRDVYPVFERPPENNYYKHPVMSEKRTRPLTYPQLVQHSCYSGYYIPAEVERVVYVEAFRSWGRFVFKNSVGSSNGLLRELEQLAEMLGAQESHRRTDGDSLDEVKSAFVQLYEIAKISGQHDLPIVFDG